VLAAGSWPWLEYQRRFPKSESTNYAGKVTTPGAEGTSLFLIRLASAKFGKGWKMSLRNAQQRMTGFEAACKATVREGIISAEMKGGSYRGL